MKNGSPSPPRAPPLLSPNFYWDHPTGTCPGKAFRVCRVPRRDEEKQVERQQPSGLLVCPEFGWPGIGRGFACHEGLRLDKQSFWGDGGTLLLCEGERETVLKNGSPSPPRAPPLLSPNFYWLARRGRVPAGRFASAASPGGMKKSRSNGNSRPACLFVQSLAGLEPGETLRATTACVWTSRVFGGWGVWGEGPFVHKGPFPPREKLLLSSLDKDVSRQGVSRLPCPPAE